MEYDASFLADFMDGWDADEEGSDAEPPAAALDDAALQAPFIVSPVDAAAMMPAPGTPLAPSPAAEAVPQVKRRRLTAKTAAAGTGYAVVPPVVLPRNSSTGGEAWKKKFKQDLGVPWSKRLSNLFGERILSPWLARNAVGVSVRDVDYKAMFDNMPEEQQKRWLMSLLPGHEAPPDEELQFCPESMEIRSVDRRAASAKFDVSQPWITSGALLTWNGDFGLFSNAAVRSIWMDLEMSADEKSKALLGVPEVMNTFLAFDTYVTAQYQKAGFEKYSCCLEASFGSMDVGRIHFHAAVSHLRSKYQNRNEWVSDDWRWRGSRPVIKKNACLKPVMSTQLINHMHFYVQANKIGHVIHETNYRTCEDFKQEAKWIMELWYVRKMSCEAAINALYEGRNRVRGNIDEIERVRRRAEAAKFTRSKEDVDRRLASLQAPWITPPLVNEWRQQYRVDASGAMVNWGVLARFKFLVLHGPSRTGKTSFAKALWGPEDTYFVPCQGVDEPNMLDFDRNKHRAVVFDECSSSVVLRSKALFQANNDFQKLGQSQCNQHCYTVWMYAVPLIVCTNTWLSDLAEDDSEGREWLMSNSYYLHVQDPMYQAVP